MNYKIILNLCQKDFINQVKETKGFCEQYLANHSGTLVVFIDDESKGEIAKKYAFLDSLNIIRINQNNPENLLNALCSAELNSDTQLYIFSGNIFGNNICTRFSYRVGGSSVNNANGINIGEKFVAKKLAYSNNLYAELELQKKPYCITTAKGAFESLDVGSEIKQCYKNISATYTVSDAQSPHIISTKIHETKEEQQLNSSKFIVAGGRGVGSKEKIATLQSISYSIGADFGVTRPVAMNGWAEINSLIGVSANICKPDICIVAGASGAGAFYGGIEKSKCIVAINSDKNSAIAKNSDIFIEGDCNLLMKSLMETIENDKK